MDLETLYDAIQTPLGLRTVLLALDVAPPPAPDMHVVESVFGERPISELIERQVRETVPVETMPAKEVA